MLNTALNTAPMAAATPLASPLPAPGPTPPQGNGGAPFAQALDQAAARQRATAADTDAAAQAEAAPDSAATRGPGHPRPTPSTGSARLAALRHATGRDVLAPLNETTGKSSPKAAKGDDTPVPGDEPRTPELADQALLDLAALLSGLPLPRVPTTDNAAPATPRGGAAERGDKAAAPCAEASTPNSASDHDLLLAMGAESAKPAATPVAAGLAMAPGLDAAPVGGSPAVAFTTPAMQDRRAQLAGADSGLESGAEGLNLALGRGRQPAGYASGSELQPDKEGLHLAVGRLRQPVGHATDIEPQPGNEGLHLALGRGRPPVGPEGSDKLPAAMAMPLANAWPLAGPRASENAPPFQAELKAALGTTEFASNLGSQLSVLVRDGIEHAQLKLNPAEMGPIEVRIRLDGTQAQVDFSAAHAATRQALQDAVPALASALLDNGLTLTGGGVFEQPREPRGEARREQPHGNAATGTTPREGAHTDTRAPRLPRARGVVDLYA